ncbi:MAG: penicillin-binding transpeptidase domain-containing protein [Thermoleophilaceae bacterium]
MTHRALPALGVLAAVALAVGVATGSGRDSGSERVARQFALAWQRGDYEAMHSLISDPARRRYSAAAFKRAYEQAAVTATADSLRVGDPSGGKGGRVRIGVRTRTRLFGDLRGSVELPVGGERVDWSPDLAFPGLDGDERLVRRTIEPRRGTIVSVDDKVLAQGPAGARSSPLGELASSIAGSVAPSANPKERTALYQRGFARDTQTGKTGLERVLDEELAGRPGGTLLAGRRVLARARPKPGGRVRSTIDTRLQQSAVTALADRLGGVAALDPRTGEVRALAGIAFSAPQPPGSTFKIVTTTAALKAGAVKLSDKFPVQTKAVIDGVDLGNANGESCGGTFVESFAESCNSVFAPLGVKVGAKDLVATAERFGFNEEPGLPGAQRSSLPQASATNTPLEVGSTAIGQFKVLATPLQMASVAQTIANDGVRLRPSLRPRMRATPVQVASKGVTDQVERLMVGVVRHGTGTAAAVPGVEVAGKTGTAELGDSRGPDGGQTSDPDNTDAWFTSYAPAGKPRIAVAVLLVRNGAGGATAAPAARIVLDRALRK